MEAQNRFAPLGGAWNLSSPILAAFISAGFSVPYPTPALNTNELRHILLCDKYKHEFTTRLQHPPVAPEALRQNNFPSPVELAQTTAALEEEEARSRAEMIRRRVGEAAESRGELAKGKRCPEKADCRVPNLTCSRSSNPCASPRIGYGNTVSTRDGKQDTEIRGITPSDYLGSAGKTAPFTLFEGLPRCEVLYMKLEDELLSDMEFEEELFFDMDSRISLPLLRSFEDSISRSITSRTSWF
ncbi:hypothetical protein Moror_12654 [Moniliophthora roreri MCA 2997]|uniref:Uncharacterized protein n=1 Tax=Moniliophthora roreri (strain MCA 2997) TaxID=1381753 RepID=V2XSQ0_MONRO|nr:hypothetical protein Moror_12654 [Moniliophthora roreri MCA 2997]